MSNLLPRAEARERHIINGDKVLRFLAIEHWSTLGVLGGLIGRAHEEDAHHFLCCLEKYGYIQRRKLYQGRVVIWVITQDGMAEVNVGAPAYQSWMLPQARQFAHEIELQRVHARARNEGWGWVRPGRRGEPVVVDAIAARPDGAVFGIEVMRSLPTDMKKWARMVGMRLYKRQEQNWRGIIYLCPKSTTLRALRRMFDRLTEVPNERGKKIALNAIHRAHFRWMLCEDFPRLAS